MTEDPNGWDSPAALSLKKRVAELEAENERLKSILGLMDECGVEEATYTVDHYGAAREEE